jgi:hypothetical protein
LCGSPQPFGQPNAPSREAAAGVCSHSGCLCCEFKFNSRSERVRFGTECVHRLCVCLWLRLVCLQAQTKAIDCAGRASLCVVGQRVIAAQQQQARDFVRERASECIVSSAINHQPRRHVHSPSAQSVVSSWATGWMTHACPNPPQTRP